MMTASHSVHVPDWQTIDIVIMEQPACVCVSNNLHPVKIFPGSTVLVFMESMRHRERKMGKCCHIL